MNPQPSDPAARAAEAAALLLSWYRDMGVDVATADEAVDWLARPDARPGANFALAIVPPQPTAPVGRPAATRPPPASPAATAQRTDAPRTDVQRPGPPTPRPRPSLDIVSTPAPRQFPTAAPDEASLAARAAARTATSIDDLQQRLAAFDGCGLKATAKSLCFFRGAPKARLMVVGEAPGAEEDKLGKPFVGPSGQMLDKMLAAIGLGEADVHVTNVIYWRPPGNRTPTPQEALVCRPFLERQVELVAPDILLLLGGPASKHILDDAEGIMRLRGKWRDVTIGTHTARAIATLHPAYLLRTPAAKRMAWRDMLAVAEALAGPATS